MKNYKVTVYVMTPYETHVEARNEEEAIEKALERDAPSELACFEDMKDYEWATGTLWEFPNLGKNEKPEVEEI